MAVDSVVRQLDQFGGIVINCTCVVECIANNPDYVNAVSLSNSCKKKKCLLSVSDHGDRCLAYPQDSTSWLIDTDLSKIKQMPTNNK